MAVVLDFILPWTQIVATAGQTVFSTVWTADVATDIVVYARTAIQAPDDATQLVSPNDYNVAFIGVGQTVQVTFLAGRTAGDIITITRDTPADRLNLFINTNFTPSMLNGQFGRLVMMIQQNDLYNLDFAPHYNISATPTAPDRIADVILPILPAGYGWRKNATNTAIEAVQTVTIPVGTIAPFTNDNRMVRTKIAGPENTIEQIGIEITDTNVIQSVAGDMGLDAAGNLLFKGIAFPNAGAAPNKILALLDATHMEWVDFSGLFALVNLSNLAATAVNVDLNPGANGTLNLGQPLLRWKDFYSVTTNTGELPGNTHTLRAFNTLTSAYINFITLTAGNPPTGVLNGDITTTTQAQHDNSQRIATTAYVDTATGGGAGANVHLSNLAAVAINQSLVGDTNNTYDLGSAAIRWKDLFVNNIKTGLASGFSLEAYNTNTLAYVTFITLTAGNPPTAVLSSSVTGTTQAAGTSDTTLATTAFVTTAVNNAITGFDFKDPVYAATTAALNTTYNNGAAGVGATLTANVNGAFATDTTSPPVNSRVLVKDQAVSNQNGIYLLTDAGSAGTPYILTRAVDFDIPAEIVPGAFVIVENGATLGGSAWIQTATVNVVGTDPVTWARFGQNLTLPLSLANGGTNSALVASNGGIVYSNAAALQILAGTATASRVLLSGSNAAPSWSTTTFPNVTVINRLLYSVANNVISDLATANNGTLVTSNTGVPSILAGPGVANNILMSQAAAAPIWSTATYPVTTTINQLLYSSAANTIAGLATANNGILVTGATGIPSIGTAIPNGVTTTTQAPGDNTTLIASTAFVQAAIGAGAGGLTLIATLTAAGSPATLDFNACFSATYDNYLIVFENWVSSGVFFAKCLIGTGAGPTFQVNNYNTANYRLLGANITGQITFNTQFDLSPGTSMAGTAVDEMSGYIFVQNVNSANYKTMSSNIFVGSAASATGGRWNGATVLTSFRFLQTGGTITSLTAKVYGFQN